MNTHTHTDLRLADLVREGLPELNAQYGTALTSAPAVQSIPAQSALLWASQLSTVSASRHVRLACAATGATAAVSSWFVGLTFDVSRGP